MLGELTAGAGSIDVFFDLPGGTMSQPQQRRPARDPDRDVIQNILDVKPEPAKPEPVKVENSDDLFGLRLLTGRLLASGGAEIDRTGVRPDIEVAASTGKEPNTDNDCLVRFAMALMARARDSRRSALLDAAKGHPIPLECSRDAAP